MLRRNSKRLIVCRNWWSASLVGACLALCWGVSAFCGEPPRVEVVAVRRVFDNGEHNAFTDLIRFREKYYLTFRSCPDGHMVHPTSSIIVLASDNLRDWKQVFRFHVPLRDTRDPHFVVFGKQLFVYTGCWWCGETAPKSYEINEHLGYGVATADGVHWEGPRILEGTYGHYIWRAQDSRRSGGYDVVLVATGCVARGGDASQRR